MTAPAFRSDHGDSWTVVICATYTAYWSLFALKHTDSPKGNIMKTIPKLGSILVISILFASTPMLAQARDGNISGSTSMNSSSGTIDGTATNSNSSMRSDTDNTNGTTTSDNASADSNNTRSRDGMNSRSATRNHTRNKNRSGTSNSSSTNSTTTY